MAVLTQTLAAVQRTDQVPVSRVIWWDELAKDNEFHIKAGWVNDIPNVWELYRMYIQVLTDANVANRRLRLENTVIFDTADPSGYWFEYYRGPNCAANGGYNHYFNRVGPVTDAGAELHSSGDHIRLHPGSFMISGDDYLQIILQTPQVGDTLRILAEYRWLNRDLVVEPVNPVKRTQERWLI